MRPMKTPTFLNDILSYVTKHSPELLTGCAVAGTVGTAILAAAATPEALRRVAKKKRELGTGEITFIDKVKATWTVYIPTAISAAVTGACIIGSHSIQSKRNAALMAAYTLSEAALREYKDKALEVLNPKQVEEIRSGVAQDKANTQPFEETAALKTGYGDSLFYDTISGRYFYSDIERVKQTIHNLNMRLFDEQFISQNELFDELGLPPTGGGYELGWNANNGHIEAEYSAIIAKDGRPCITISYQVSPHFRYLA